MVIDSRSNAWKDCLTMVTGNIFGGFKFVSRPCENHKRELFEDTIKYIKRKR